MANWKKMAEAFGRAMNERVGNGNKAARAAINESEIVKAANNGVTKDPDIDAIRAYRKGLDEGAINYYAGVDRAPLPPSREEPRPSDVSRKISEIEDENSDEALKFSRQKEWDDAFKQSTDKFKSQSSSLTDEDADAWKSELLRTIDVLRKRGFSDADILNTIKGK